jgi:hypothetical protein
MSSNLHVVEVLNDRELVVFGGELENVFVDDVLLVVSEPRELISPIVTDRTLGSVVEVKAVVRVYEAAHEYALARTFRTEKVQVSRSGGIFSPPQLETRIEPLTDSVKPGDPIRNGMAR